MLHLPDPPITQRIVIKSRSKSTDPYTKRLESPKVYLSTPKDYEKYLDCPKRSINQYTITRDHIPAWMGGSDYIYHGYRRPTNTYAGCLLSLMYQHNESGNVYTHLIGFILTVQYTYFLLCTMYNVETTLSYDYLVHLAFLAGLMMCLFCSTTFHLCCCHSQHVSALFNKVDYIGIVCLQVGSFIPVLYYGFYCDVVYQTVYILSIVILGSITLWITVHPKYTTAQYRSVRIGIFTLLGVSGVIPVAHLAHRYGWKMIRSSIGVNYILLEALMYLVGAFIYSHRYPEIWFPDGVFDIWGHSHQIWHVLVLTAAFSHYFGVLKSFEWWHENNPMCTFSDQEMISWF